MVSHTIHTTEGGAEEGSGLVTHQDEKQTTEENSDELAECLSDPDFSGRFRCGNGS
jgi:hypothetical protein